MLRYPAFLLKILAIEFRRSENDEKVEMDFRRAGCCVCFAAIDESGADEPAGRERFDGDESAAAANRRDFARGVLRLPFLRDQMAVVFARRASVVADCQRCERRASQGEFFRLAVWPTGLGGETAGGHERRGSIWRYAAYAIQAHPRRRAAHSRSAQTIGGLARFRSRALEIHGGNGKIISCCTAN
jgi:hypothetical protein